MRFYIQLYNRLFPVNEIRKTRAGNRVALFVADLRWKLMDTKPIFRRIKNTALYHNHIKLIKLFNDSYKIDRV